MTNTNTSVKVTKAMALEYVLENFKDKMATEYAEKIATMLEVERKPRKATKAQEADEKFKVAILASLSDNKEHNLEYFMGLGLTDTEGKALSNQKLTSLLTSLKNIGMVDRTVIKGTPHYKMGVTA